MLPRLRLALVVLVTLAAPANATITLHDGSNPLLLGTGHSIMARGVLQPANGLLDLLNAQMQHGHPALAAPGSVSATASGTHFAKHMGFRFVNTGINGNTLAQLLARVQTGIVTYQPDIVILDIGVNDMSGSLPTIEGTYNSIMSAVTTALPSAQVGMTSVLCFGENWAAGTPNTWANGADDATMNGLNAYMGTTLATTYAANSATFIDNNTPLLQTWEPVFNAPAPGAAEAFTTEGVHPLIPASEVQIGAWDLPSFTIVH